MEKEQLAKIIQYASTCLTLPFLYAIKYYFYKNFLGFKHKAWPFALCAFLLTLMDFPFIQMPSEVLSIIMNDVIWLILICFLCKGDYLTKIFAAIVPSAILLLTNLIFLPFDFWILPFSHNSHMSFNTHMIITFLNCTISDLIGFAILFIVLKYLCSVLELKEKELNLYQGLYLVLPSLSSYGLAIIFYIIQTIKLNNKEYNLANIFPKVYLVLPFVSFALLASILITSYTFKKMLEGEEELAQNILMEQQLKLQLTHSKNIEELYSGVRSVKHDMNNHLSCLRNLATTNNIEELQKYLENMGQTIDKLDFQIKTGNPISDAVLNEKYNFAKAQGIEFMCDFIIPKEINLEPVDLCVILSNSVDNAIEACLRIIDENIPRTICLKSYIRDAYLIIEISNSTVEKLKYVKNKIISTKPDKCNHGIGIPNIEAIIKKYYGIIDIIEGKSKFTINIMLKVN